jgi:hypothetical protein
MALVAVGLCVFAAPARAETYGSCNSAVADALELSYPTNPVAFRKVSGSINAYNALPWTPQGKITLSLYPGDSDKAFWTVKWDSGGFWINLSRLNVRYRLEATVTYENFNGQTCTTTQVRRMRTIRGKSIRVALTAFDDRVRIKWRCPTWDDERIDPASLDFTVDDVWDYRFVFIDEYCDGSSKASNPNIKSRNWSMRTSLLLNSTDIVLKPGIPLIRLNFHAEQGKKTLLKFRIRARWLDRPSRRIYAGTDAYWNYCVNKGRPVRVENGYFFCWTPDRSRYKIKVTRR